MYLKISPMKGVVRFGNKWKLSPHYVDPYEIFQRVGKVAYEFKLHSELASIHPISMFPCIRSVSLIPCTFFLFKVLV